MEETPHSKLETSGFAYTLLRYHANIRKALQQAFIDGIILSNPADRTKRPKAEPFFGNFYNQEELLK